MRSPRPCASVLGTIAALIAHATGAHDDRTTQYVIGVEVRHGFEQATPVRPDHPSPINFVSNSGELWIQMYDSKGDSVASIRCDASAPEGTRASMVLGARGRHPGTRRHPATIESKEQGKRWTGSAQEHPKEKILQIAIGTEPSQVDKAAEAWLIAGAQADFSSARLINAIGEEKNQQLLLALQTCLAGWSATKKGRTPDAPRIDTIRESIPTRSTP